MRVGVAIASVCAVVISTAFVVLLVSPRKTEVVKSTSAVPKESAPQPGEDFPPLAKKPPYPKAVIKDTEFEFGRMEVGEERVHDFVIHNEGEAPLLLTKGPTTCQCTVSDLETGQIEAGGSARITLKWKPVAQAEQFSKGAEIRTNDPDHRSIQLRVVGIVAPRLLVFPEGTWESPDLLEREPTVVNGSIFSPVADEFHVVSLESGTPLITAESLPMDKRQLEEKHALSGYSISVSVSPDVPIGPFSFPLKIKTDLPGRKSDGTFGDAMGPEVLITGHRRGPIRIVGGANWDEKSMTVIMGSFDAKAGKKLTLPVFVHGAGAKDFRLLESPECDPQALQVTLVPVETSQGKQGRFLLTLEYPAGAPRVSHHKENPGKVRLHTNLPGAPEINLSVWLAATLGTR
jgi:hypothetical protein